MNRMIVKLSVVLMLGSYVNISGSLPTKKSASSKEADWMAYMYDNYVRQLLIALDSLQGVLKLEDDALAAAVRQVDDYQHQERIKGKCVELQVGLKDLRLQFNKLYSSVHQSNDLSWQRDLWQATAGLIRFYAELHRDLQNNFAIKPEQVGQKATIYDGTTARWSKVISQIKKPDNSWQQDLALNLGLDDSWEKKILAELKITEVVAESRLRLSEAQYIELLRISRCTALLQQEKRAISELSKNFGLGWSRRQARTCYEYCAKGAALWHTSPSFRFMTIAGGTAAVGGVVGAVGISLLGFKTAMTVAGAGLGTAATTVGMYVYAGVGQRAGNSITDSIIDTGKDLASGVIELTAAHGRVGEFADMIARVPREGGAVVKIVRPRDFSESAIIGDECRDALRLANTMIQSFIERQSKEDRERRLSNQKKNFLFHGDPGVGKTFRTKFIINEIAKEARKFGITVYHVYFTPQAIARNDMEAIATWFEGQKNAILIYDFDDIAHADISQEGNKSAYRFVLDFSQNLSESGKPALSVATTNRPNMPSDYQRRTHIIYLGPADWKTRRKYFETLLESTGYFPYTSQDLNMFASLSEGAKMSQLTDMKEYLAERKNRRHVIDAQAVEKAILCKIHGRQKRTHGVVAPAIAVQIAGKLIVNLHRTDMHDILEGKVAVVASTRLFKQASATELKPYMQKGRFVFSSHAQDHVEEPQQQLKTFVAGYIMQELFLSDPQKRSLGLIQQDQQAARLLCKKMLSEGIDENNMTSSEQTAWYNELSKKVEERLKHIEADVRTTLQGIPSELLEKTIEKIRSQEDISAREYVQLYNTVTQKQRGKKNDTSIAKSPVSLTPPAMAARNQQKSA